MGRSPCCDKMGLKRGPWTQEEDYKLISYIRKYGHGNWRALPKFAGLLRCGKSCRLRWTNYLRPDIKRGHFSPEEEEKIIRLHAIMGNRWSTIASHLPGRTDNEIKNVWNTHLKKRLLRMGIDPCAHEPSTNAANMQKWSSNSSFSDMALLRHTTEQENTRQDAETPPSLESTEVITSLGLTDVRPPEVTENAHELHRQTTLCIDFHEMDNLLEHALEFPAVETKPEENITFDGYQQNAWNMSFYPNSACISSTSPVESSISTVGTDETSLLTSLNPLPEGHDLCKLFHNYNLGEGESLVVDEGSLFESQTMAETEQENPYQQYESASDPKLQYSASALEDTTSPAAAPFCSQISLCPSENVGTLDDPLPSPANAYCTHRLSEQIVGDDGSTATTQLCPHISSDFCAADVLLNLPDDTSIDGILQLDELSEENFWSGLLQRVGHVQPSLYYTLY